MLPPQFACRFYGGRTPSLPTSFFLESVALDTREGLYGCARDTPEGRPDRTSAPLTSGSLGEHLPLFLTYLPLRPPLYFRELRACELRRIHLPRTRVNKGLRTGHSLVGLAPSRQPFPEALRDGLEQSLKFRDPVSHPLAVGCNHVFPVGEHPVEAVAATD